MLAFFKMHLLATTAILFFVKINSVSGAPPAQLEDIWTHSASCHLTVHQNVTISENLLNLMSNNKRNVINLGISVEWVNYFTNESHKIHSMTGVKLANEIDRTVIWLTDLFGELNLIMLPSYLNTLLAGVDSIDIHITITDETKWCFLPENIMKLDQHIFNLLLHQLYRVSSKNTNYKLYLLRNYKCCLIAERNDTEICSDYSSIATKSYSILILLTTIFLLYVALPMIIDYISRHTEKNTHYKISHSPMSITSIFCALFIEGYHPVTSFLRRLVCVFFVLVTTLTNSTSIVFHVIQVFWAVAFTIEDVFNFNTNKDVYPIKWIFRFETPFEILAFPFNYKLWRSLRIKITRKNVNPENQRESQDSHQRLGFLQTIKRCLSVVISLVLYIAFLPYLCSSVLALLIYAMWKQTGVKTQDRILTLSYVLFRPWLLRILQLLTLGLFMQSMRNSLVIMFYLTVVLFLNGEIYSPYFLPLSTILFYSWTNWKSSVETKYLVLATSIYEVCKESARDNTEEVQGHSDIILDEKGVPAISKKFYDLAREELLPYDRVLYFYFQGVFFVLIFACFLFITMSLAQASGISNVQVVGTIAGTLLPFIFDVVWKKDSHEQKAANKIALKSELRRVLSHHWRNHTETN